MYVWNGKNMLFLIYWDLEFYVALIFIVVALSHVDTLWQDLSFEIMTFDLVTLTLDYIHFSKMLT